MSLGSLKNSAINGSTFKQLLEVSTKCYRDPAIRLAATASHAIGSRDVEWPFGGGSASQSAP